jgi:6-phosphogluconolactonase
MDTRPTGVVQAPLQRRNHPNRLWGAFVTVVATLPLAGPERETVVAAEAPAARPRDAVAEEVLVWFGTYTRGGGEPASEGIYVSRMNLGSGEVSPASVAGGAVNPSFLALHPTRPLLYAVAEIAVPMPDAPGARGAGGGRPGGGIRSFVVDFKTGRLTAIDEQPSGGAGPCHVAVDPSGRCAVAANYGGGSAICLRIGSDGGLQPVVEGPPGGFLQHDRSPRAGAGVNPRRQEGPHAHCARPSPDGRYLLVPDLGRDRVFVHALDALAGSLVPHGSVELANGAGPRHVAFDPAGRRAYVINELDLTVTAMWWDAERGALEAFQTVSTLPADVTDREGFSTAEVVVHPGGGFVYGSNRGHDSIAMYAVDRETGRLTFLGVEPIRGKVPRNFAIDPTGRWLLAAGQDSGTVTVFAIDPASGRLRFTGRSIEVPRPVCVLFGRPTG